MDDDEPCTQIEAAIEERVRVTEAEVKQGERGGGGRLEWQTTAADGSTNSNTQCVDRDKEFPPGILGNIMSPLFVVKNVNSEYHLEEIRFMSVTKPNCWVWW